MTSAGLDSVHFGVLSGGTESDQGPTAPAGAALGGGRDHPRLGMRIYFPGSTWGSTYSLCGQVWVLLLPILVLGSAL